MLREYMNEPGELKAGRQVRTTAERSLFGDDPFMSVRQDVGYSIDLIGVMPAKEGFCISRSLVIPLAGCR